VGQWHNFLVGESGVVVHNSYFDDLVLGEKLGGGGEKFVYEIVGHPERAIGKYKSVNMTKNLEREVEVLAEIEGKNLPVVEILETGKFENFPSIIYKRYAGGSKELVKTSQGKVFLNSADPLFNDTKKLLNKNSIDDLIAIKKTMKEGKVKIDDLQFLISKEGKIVISDPLGVSKDIPSTVNLGIIDNLIDLAQKNL
jgi:hypothetical protein